MEKNNIIRPYGETEINKHAAKFGGKRNLREIIVESEGEQYAFLVKKPSRAVVQAIGEAGAKKDYNAVQKLNFGCVLEGDKDALEYDGAIYVSVVSKIAEMVEKAKVEVKKL